MTNAIMICVNALYIHLGHIGHRNIYRGVPLIALKSYPSKYQNLKKIRTHPNTKCEENYGPDNIVQLQKIY